MKKRRGRSALELERKTDADAELESARPLAPPPGR
jgi:hypothetical protein